MMQLVKFAFTRQSVWINLLLNILIIFSLSVYAFSHNHGIIFVGNDGPTGFSLADEQLTYFGITLDLHSNLLEGLSNLSLPSNLTLNPGYWYSVFVSNNTFAKALIYAWFSLQLFLSVLLIGWNYQFSKRATYTAAWLLTILLFPYFESFRIYPITSSMPNFINLILAFAVMVVGIQRAGEGGLFESIKYAGLLLLGLTIGIVTSPAGMTLLAPALLMATVYAILTPNSRHVIINKIMIFLAILLLVISAGWLAYLSGLLLNSAGMYFNNEMNASGADTSSLIYTSILFHGSTPGMAVGPWLFICSVMGCFVHLMQKSKLKLLALTVLLFQFGIVVGGIVGMKLFPAQFSTISLVYFEVSFFPLYALFAVELMLFVFDRIYFMPMKKMQYEVRLALICLLVISISLLIIGPKKNNHGNYSTKPDSTVLTDILEREIGMQNGKPFAGRVANIIPGMNWLEQMQYAGSINMMTGNDHQSTGLWLKHIPTLHEYSQSITPGFYRIYRRFLSDGTDNPQRSWSNFNKVNLQILELLGVRYILSTQNEITGAVVEGELNAGKNIAPLFLHRLKVANVAGIAATRLVLTNNLHEAEALMSSPAFDVHDAIVVSTTGKLKQILSQVEDSYLSVENGGYKLQANSKGEALLILPIEYSHCLNVTTVSGKKPQVVRVDLALTGILFDKFVHIKLDNRTGPFFNPGCRLEDYREFDKLWKIKSIKTT